jgi:hypothetical protein
LDLRKVIQSPLPKTISLLLQPLTKIPKSREVSAERLGDNSDYGKISPQLGAALVSSTNLTCGRLASNSAKKTKTADVVAGEPIAIGVGEYYGNIFHQGPAQAYMSRAPNDDIENYHGDGDWFKIAYWGPLSDTKWSSDLQVYLNFTIPKTTPPGKYLLRVEQWWPLKPPSSVQWYVNCAQVNVIGPGGGKLILLYVTDACATSR